MTARILCFKIMLKSCWLLQYYAKKLAMLNIFTMSEFKVSRFDLSQWEIYVWFEWEWNLEDR